jgi:LCP family protein required for cell wall assembly
METPKRPGQSRAHVGWRRRRIAIISAIAMVSMVAGALIAKRTNYASSVVAQLTMGAKPVNILVIANNARGVKASDPLGLGSAAGQADVILLAHIDPQNHAIYAITIPRDTLVAQPHWNDPVPKIKTLFFMGDQDTPPTGPMHLERAVSALTGLPIDGYIAANFAGFRDAVNLVGGLTIDVKERIYDPRNSGADFHPGVQHMDGKQVLEFVRVRQNQAGNNYRINDFQRMQAEVQVLGLLRNKLLNPATAASVLPNFVAKIKRDVATNLSQNKLVRIGIAMAGAPVYQVPLGSIADSMVLAPTDIPGINAEGHLDGDYYDVLDPANICKRLAEFGASGCTTGFGPLPNPHDVAVTLYGTQHLALHLEHQGFSHVTIAGGPTGEDRVLYPAASPEAGLVVARAVSRGNTLVEPGNVSSVVVEE